MEKGKGSNYIDPKDEDKEKSKGLEGGKRRKGIANNLIDLCSAFLPVCLATMHFIPDKWYKNNSRSETEED